MAVYSKLLLSTGGGIISANQQAEQAKDTATILIGLGGTGVHCIRTIKTQVRMRLKPDDETAVIPTYEHIRFIGVDSTEKSRGGALSEIKGEDADKANGIAPLDDTEFFSIANLHVSRAFSNTLALRQRQDLAWLDYEHIKTPNLTDAGAGGIRQVGRFMMMDRSTDFLNKLQEEIAAAKRNLKNPRVNVHIFAGLSGGTGSGCFLDVCYMVRSLAGKIGGVTVFGYFFLPDVNLSNVPYEYSDVRSYIPKNGYAAMQELDYCMCLQQNGGSFDQVYQGHNVVSWNNAPVDMCHLICATDRNNNEIPNAYQYAMNVTSEYVMDFLTDSDKEFGLTEHLANFRAMVGESDAKKTIGSEMAYCVIGAACASIPLREINTYLASELFNKFASIEEHTPSKSDVEKLAINALARSAGSISEVYEALLAELRADATGEYAGYRDDWKFVKQYGNSELVTSYTNQTASQIYRLVANAKSMSDPKNPGSLISRIRAELENILRDLNRGPIYAYRMVLASQSHNLLNVIDGLIAENEARWTDEAAQNNIRRTDYEYSKDEFDRRPNKKHFAAYEYYLMLFEQHKLSIEAYSRLKDTLAAFKRQLEDVTAYYYIKLARVMETLINTFKENRDALANVNRINTGDSFTIPMMTINELKKTLDAQIEKVNIPNMLDSFMSLLVNNEDSWISEDENKIARLVNGFFVKMAFSDFANRTITRFLKDKYENKYGGIISDEQLTNYIYNDWMKTLTASANPLFYFDSSIWSESMTSKLAFLSFPESSDPIKQAAERMHAKSKLWGLKESALTDRIFVMSSAVGLPLSSYSNCAEYERNFFSAKAAGRHYYEGKPQKGMEFTDWNKLPSITPQSVSDVSILPEDIAREMTRARELFDRAKEFGVIDDDGYYCKADDNDVAKLDSLTKRCMDYASNVTKPQEIQNLEQLTAEVEKAMHFNMIRTEFALPSDGYRQTAEDILRIQKDHFVSYPATHPLVENYCAAVELALSNAAEAIKKSKETAGKIKDSGSSIGEYCDALFTGVLSIEGRTIVYHRNEFGIMTDIPLSRRGDEFFYNSIPVYQGYVSFGQLKPEIKMEIKTIVDDRLDKDAPEIYSTGKLLKEQFTDERMTAMAQLAENFENRNEIVQFLGEIKKCFNTHCLQSGI